jgi:hypothetical protein
MLLEIVLVLVSVHSPDVSSLTTSLLTDLGDYVILYDN